MSGRMRRVDEALKQVLSETIPTLKDPRIGFVTVTAVETTSDLDHAKVWVSVLGGESQQKKTLRALDGAAGVLQGRIGKELGLRRTPRLEFVYDRAVEQGVRMTRLIDELAPPTETTMPSSDIDAVVEALRAGDRFVVTSHDNPDGDALGSLLAMHLALVSLGKDSVMVLGGEQPLPVPAVEGQEAVADALVLQVDEVQEGGHVHPAAILDAVHGQHPPLVPLVDGEGHQRTGEPQRRQWAPQPRGRARLLHGSPVAPKACMGRQGWSANAASGSAHG